MKCPICQTPLQNGVCPSCGFSELSAPEPAFCPDHPDTYGRPNDADPFYIPSRPKRGHKAILLLIGIILGIVVLFFSSVAIMAFTNFSENSSLTPAYPESFSGEENGILPDANAIEITDGALLKLLTGQKVHAATLAPTVLYEQDGLTITARSLSFESDYYGTDEIGRVGLDLYIQNDSELYWNVQVEPILANGVVVSTGGWFGVAAGDRYSATVDLDSSMLLRAGITDISSLAFDLTCSDDDSFRSYAAACALTTDQPASFADIPVRILVAEQNGVRVSYLGRDGYYDSDEQFIPRYWFYLENNAAQGILATAAEMALDGKYEESPCCYGGSIPAGESGFLVVEPSPYAIDFSYDAPDEVGYAEILLQIHDENTGELILDSLAVQIQP